SSARDPHPPHRHARARHARVDSSRRRRGWLLLRHDSARPWYCGRNAWPSWTPLRVGIGGKIRTLVNDDDGRPPRVSDVGRWGGLAWGRAGLARRRALGGVIEGTPIKPTIRPDDDTGISRSRHH